jgi:molybdenum cofactor cytidylyltransferase
VTVGILMLAAGSSRRYGSDKRHALMRDGQTVLGRSILQAQRSGLPLLLCLPAADQVTAGALRERGVDYCLCEEAALGMGSTLAEGIVQVKHWDGVLVALADMPYIASQTYTLVADALCEDRVCLPRFDGKRGHPVGFGKGWFAQLARLGGDEGARSLLRRYPERVSYLAVKDAGILRDIDYPRDNA